MIARRRRLTVPLLLFALVASSFIAAAPAAADPMLLILPPVWSPGPTITNLDGSGSWKTSPNAINSAAKIAGRAKIGTRTHAFLWQNGSTTDLGTLSPDSYSFWPRSEAFGINQFGHVVGYSDTDIHDPKINAMVEKAFLFQGSVMTPLFRGRAYGINSAGQVVGFMLDGNSYSPRAVLWHNSKLTTLETPRGFTNAEARAINDSGQVVVTAHGTHSRAFVWQDGSMTPIGTLGGQWSFGKAINIHGHIVGNADRPGYWGEHAFIYKPGSGMTALGNLPGHIASGALGINAYGAVVGYSMDANYNKHAVMWQNGVIRDLTATLSAGSGWNLTSATAINDYGRITGAGTLNGVGHGFLYTPYEPVLAP
jgi:probable HAF family extracellular repeat protein